MTFGFANSGSCSCICFSSVTICFDAVELDDDVIVVVDVEAVIWCDVVVTGIQVFSIFEWCRPDETGNWDIKAFSSLAGFGGIGIEF